MEQKGVITVYLALTLAVLLSLIAASVEAVRENTLRFQTECAMDAALYSVFAEYNRTLLNDYDLFYIDTTYGTKQGSYEFTEQRLLKYMQYNLEPQKDLILPGFRDFLGLSANAAVTKKASLASDYDCMVLKQQALAYMQDKIGIPILEKIAENVRIVEEENLEEGKAEERLTVQDQIDSYDNQKVLAGDDEWVEIEVDNPADAVNSQRGSGALYLVTQDSGGISGTQVSVDGYVSKRELRQGEGLPPGEKEADGSLSELLFGEYILEKCGDYTEPKENGRLKYQVEYILAGKNSDLDNLKWVVDRLLILRETANYLYLMMDAEKNAEAEAMAAGVSAVAMIPELKDLIKQALLFAWAYAESVNDVKILLEKGHIPLQKKADDWKMSITDMLHYKSCLTSGDGSDSGMNYQDYLRVFLALSKKKEKAVRLGDVIEMDIRKSSSSPFFRLDYCVGSMEVEAAVSSSYGYEYTIRRRYGYERL